MFVLSMDELQYADMYYDRDRHGGRTTSEHSLVVGTCAILTLTDPENYYENQLNVKHIALNCSDDTGLIQT